MYQAIIVPIGKTHTDGNAGKQVYVNPAYLANPAYIALHIMHNFKTRGLSTQYSKDLNNNSTGQDDALHQINITPVKHLFIDVQAVRFSPDVRDDAPVKIGSY